MTNREEELLERIRHNPAISQNELANALGITRSSVAVHITNLMKKGQILGKGYILREDDYVCVLGGANIDISGFPHQQLVARDSNPGHVKISLGGVGRNIAENLVHLGVPTKLITAIGDDLHGKRMLDHAAAIGLDMRQSLILGSRETSTYLAIHDQSGDMHAAISFMDILDEMTIDLIQSRRQALEKARICVLDTNLPAVTISYVLDKFKGTDFFLDAVSTAKAIKVKANIGAFHTVKANRLEAEVLAGFSILNDQDIKRAADRLHVQGVRHVFITLGESGIFYSDGSVQQHIDSPSVQVINATGAGDAFAAALVYGHYHQLTLAQTARLALGASILKLQHEDTINPNLSIDKIEQTLKAYAISG